MAGQLEYARLDDLYLDPRNPRLGRAAHLKKLDQDALFDRMRDWSLEELATSIIESGFWPHEAILCAQEDLDGLPRLIAIEGNRRVAALKRLRQTFDGTEQSSRWKDIVAGYARPDHLFENVPFIRFPNRADIDAFLGFRHVTGIKEWAPPEKAQFIAKLIEDRGLSYREVMRKIGSKTDVVERNYVAYCILRQMEEVEDLDVEEVEKRFSVLFLALRNKNVRTFLGIEGKFGVAPEQVMPPIDQNHIKELQEFSLWLFGSASTLPVVPDSREIDKFARVLASDEGVDYLRTVRRPNLDTALIISGGDKEEVLELLSAATYNLQQALSSVHLYKNQEQVRSLAIKLIAGSEQLRTTLEIAKSA